MNDPPDIDESGYLKEDESSKPRRRGLNFKFPENSSRKRTTNLFSGFRESGDALGHNERHLIGRRGMNGVHKDAANRILLRRLAPVAGPAKDDGVGLQPS